jgi:MFS family permease
MFDIIKHRFLKYFLFGGLYFTEGIEFALATIIIPIYLNVEKGFPISITTLIAGIVMIPWTLKFIWGGIVDHFIRYGRKKFILIGGLLSVVSFFILVFIDPDVTLIPFVFLLLISHIGVGFIDVSVDAWAIDISTENERGKINSAMWIGQLVGWSAGAYFLSLIAQKYGYNITFLTTGLIVLLVISLSFFIKETKIIKKIHKLGSLIIKEFKIKTTQLVAIFGFFITASAGMLIFTMPLYISNSFHLNVDQVGLISSIIPIVTIFGAFIGGIIYDRLDRKIPLFIFVSGSIIFTSSLIFANTWEILIVIYIFIGLLMGGYIVGVNTLLMDVTNPKIGATQFSILTSISNFGEISAGIIAGTLIAMLGFGRVFLYIAWFLGPALLILYFINLKKI